MKKILLLVSIFVLVRLGFSQQNYCDFESNRHIWFNFSTGVLDTAAINAVPGTTNLSPYCGRYYRDTTLYDVIKMYPDTTLSDVSPYAVMSGSAPHITMKLYSTAPVGTPVQIQLGKKGDDNYPSGVHSIYTAFTSVQNAWENVTFTFYQIPSGSTVAANQVDKIILLLNPAANVVDTFYFDDLSGPSILPNSVGIKPAESLSVFKLFQNNTNPAREVTNIRFQLTLGGPVSLKLYDVLGNPVQSLLNEELKAGHHSIPVQTEYLPAGIYFYVLKKEGLTRTMKMTVTK